MLIIIHFIIQKSEIRNDLFALMYTNIMILYKKYIWAWRPPLRPEWSLAWGPPDKVATL